MDEQTALSDVRGSTTHLVPHTVIPVDKLPLHMRSSSAMSLSTKDTSMPQLHSSIAPKTNESPSGNVQASAPTVPVKEKEQIVPHTVIPLEKLHHNRQDSVGSLPDKEKELNASASSPTLKAGLKRQLSRRMLENPLKELEQSSKYATMLIIVLEIQFFLDAIISATFIALEAVPTLMLLDAMNFTDNIVSDSSFLFRWLQVGGSFLSFLCSIICLVYILRPYHPRNLRPIFLFLISVKLFCFLVDITNFTYPTSQRIALAATLIFIHLSTVITLVIMFFRTPTFYLKPSERGHVDSKKTLIKLFEKNDGKASEKALEGLRRVERTLAIERVRKRHKKRLLGGAKYLGWVTAIFLVCLSLYLE
ncbi:hypothetical protein BKA69DRAFT_53099 [Paraphysoderma sedebokerense]|nr:hypothetical protein BKA69DRAFT_53099 [Paraphysoderma sedebokerense]